MKAIGWAQDLNLKVDKGIMDYGPRTMDQGLWTKSWRRILFVLLLVPGPWSLVRSPVFAAQPTLSSIQIDGTFSEDKNLILALLPFKEGDSFDPHKLDEGVDYLKKWGIFDIIDAKTETTPHGILIEIHLHEAEVVSNIFIKGNYPYVQTKIKKRLSLQVGDMVTPEFLEEQVGRIKTFYTPRGFYNTRVDIHTEPASTENDTDVTFHIYKGNRLRYGHVAFEGVESFRKARMTAFIGPLDIYTDKAIKGALQRLVAFYRGRGYLKAKATVLEKKIDWNTNRVSIKIGVTEGPRVLVHFRGRTHYRLKTLKETITIYQDGNFDNAELENSVEALLKKFEQDGYHQAKVTFEKKKINSNLTHIIFNIEPGIYSRIQSIAFSGNQSIPTRKLKKQLLTKTRSLSQKGILQESILSEDQKITEQFYKSRGFSDVEVGKPQVTKNSEKTKMHILFQVNEGPQVKVEKIIFEGNESAKREDLLKTLTNKEGDPLDELSLTTDREHLELYYKDHGHPYSAVDQKILRENNKVTITYTIHEGPLVRIGEILIVGDVLTSVKAIRQAMDIKSGDPYSYQKILNSEISLRRLGAFDSVHIDTFGLEEKENTIPLKVQVAEREPFSFSVDAQYSTDLKYAGNMKFTNLNSFGWAKQTGLLLRGGPKTDRVELSWFDPRFSGNDIQMTLASWMDYENNPIDATLQGGGSVGFYRQFHRFGFLTRYELDRNYNLRGVSPNPSALRDNTLSQITVSGTFDTKNSFSDPSKGFYTLSRITLSDEIRGLEANFLKLRQAFSYYYTPLRRLTFSNAIRLDSIQGLGANVSVPQKQLFGLGGDDTVRGFREDVLGPTFNGSPIGGKARVIYNGEARIRLVGALQWAFFFDAGSLTNSFFDIDNQTLRRSAGFGLRYVTPVGPIRADYGIVLDRQPGDNFGRLHVTFGYPF